MAVITSGIGVFLKYSKVL